MPAYRLPRSDPARKEMLFRAARTDLMNRAAGRYYLSQATLEAVQAFLPTYEAAISTVTQRRVAYLRATREAREALERVKTFVRDLWEGTRRRVKRHGEPAYVLRHYRLSGNGTPPQPGKRSEWLLLAGQIIAGDAEAVAQGHPPAISPSAAELQAVLEVAQAKANGIAPADRAYDQAQEALAGLREQADALIQDIMDDLRYALRKLDAPSQRRIMRHYGARFRSLPGEMPEERGEETETPL